MAYCRYCGKKMDDTSAVCPSCGGSQFDDDKSTQNTQSAGGTQPTGTTVEDSEYDAQDIEKTKVVCAISYVSILFFLPLVVYPDSRFGKFHANQALLLLILSVVISALVSIPAGIIGGMSFIPEITRKVISGTLSAAGGAVTLAGMIFGIVNAANGKAKELPVIGHINLINK